MQLGVGEVVRIFGLTSDKGRELNGREATVLTEALASTTPAT